MILQIEDENMATDGRAKQRTAQQERLWARHENAPRRGGHVLNIIVILITYLHDCGYSSLIIHYKR
jgi:hypothetical protein